MWKTRFEVRTSHNNGFTRHRYYSRPSPTVPRVREDSPSAIVRPSPPSSISNLEILPEEDEDIPFINNEQPNLTSLNIRKQNSYQNLPKYQFVLPTIVESHDHEILIDNESYDDKCKQDNSFVATNTNYNNPIENIDYERTLKNNEMMEFTLDKRINELLQQKKSQRQNKSTEIDIPTTFKDISAFFENKALTASSEQKKMIRAKRSLVLNRQIPFNNNDLTKSSTTEKESMIFHHQIKRIKTTHRSTFDSAENNIQSKSINGTSTKKTVLKRWFIPLLFIITILVYFDLFNLTKISIRLNSNSPSKVFPKETMHLVNHNIIFQYGQFVRNHFFSSLDLLLTFLGQLFFSY